MLIAIAVVCTLCEAVFTALEIAMSAISRTRLRTLIEAERNIADSSGSVSANEHAASGHADARKQAETESPIPLRRATRLLRLLEQRERLTLMFIVITSLSLWTAASALAWHSWTQNWPLWALPLCLLAMLFVAEVLPLLLAAHRTEVFALQGAKLVSGALTLLSPVMFVLGGLGHGMARLTGAGPNATAQVTAGELRTALAAAEEEGTIESDERAMLEGAMDFRETRVREVMTPRIDMVAASADATLSQVLQIALHEGHSRVPIYEDTPDAIIGIVSTKDLIPHLRRQLSEGAHSIAGSEPQLCARDVARRPVFVPQDKRIAPTLEDLRRERTLMAIVIDDNGGTAGLVTLEDLLEEIVGEIQDEYDEEEPAMQVIARVQGNDSDSDLEKLPDGVLNNSASDGKSPVSNAILCDSGVSVRDAQRFWKRNFSETIALQNARGENADGALSLAALALQLFEAVPATGDAVIAGALAGAASSSSGDSISSVAENAADLNSKIGSAAAQTAPVVNASSVVVQLHIEAMNGARIEKVRLEKTARRAQ